MSQERHITVRINRGGAGGGPAFDGSSLLPYGSEAGAEGWADGGPSNTKDTYFEGTTVVGRFRPATLGRTKFKHSRFRVYCDGPITQGDVVFVRGSLNVDPADRIVPPNPLRTVSVPLTTSLEAATRLELGPNDDICVVHAGDGEAATLHFVGYDLDEAQLDRQDLLALLIQAQAQIVGGAVTIRNQNAAGTIDPWPTGHLYVFVDAPAGSVVRVPAIADVAPPGANGPVNLVTFVRVGGGVVLLQSQNGELANGQAAPAWAVELSAFEAVTWERVGAGWVVTKAPFAGPTFLSNAVIGGSVNIPIPTSPTSVVQLDFSADGDAILPTTADWPLGNSTWIMRAPGLGNEQVRFRPPAGELLNSQADGLFYLSPNHVALVRRTLVGYMVSSDGVGRPAGFTQVGGAAVNVQPWGLHELFLELNGAGAQTATLPARARVPAGAPISVLATNAAKTVSAAAGETIVGVATAPALTFGVPQNTVRRFVALGATQWGAL